MKKYSLVFLLISVSILLTGCLLFTGKILKRDEGKKNPPITNAPTDEKASDTSEQPVKRILTLKEKRVVFT